MWVLYLVGMLPQADNRNPAKHDSDHERSPQFYQEGTPRNTLVDGCGFVSIRIIKNNTVCNEKKQILVPMRSDPK